MEKLSNDLLSIQVSAAGAELCSIQCNGKEYLWQADPAFWNRHSPVLFPIVGRVWDNTYRCEGETYSLGQHGFARDMEFQLVSITDNEVWYRLTDNEETHKKYPYNFCLEIGYRIEQKKIHVMWRVKNTGTGDMYFQIGAHPAFYFPGFDASTKERGYFGFDKKEGLEYILIGEKGCANTDVHYPLELKDGLLPMNTSTFDSDALILENGQVGEVALYDNSRKAVLRLLFDAPVVGLWSPPGKNAPFVCIEPWYGRCDRMNFDGEYKEKDWIQHLPENGTFDGDYVIEIME